VFVCDDFYSQACKSSLKHLSVESNALSHLLQTSWSMPDAVEGSHVRKQVLSGANVAGSFVSADMLLSRLKGHAVCQLSVFVS